MRSLSSHILHFALDKSLVDYYTIYEVKLHFYIIATSPFVVNIMHRIRYAVKEKERSR